MTTRNVGLVLAMAVAAVPAWADKKVDEAVARAEQQIQRGHPEEALKTLEKTASQSPSSEAYVALARLQARLGSVEESAASAGKAVELAGSADPAVRADVLATVSQLTLQRGPGRKALEHAQEAVKAQETPASLAALALAQARTQQSVAALQSADKAISLGATSAVAQLARGNALLALGRATEAEAALRKAVELDPKLTAAKVELTRALVAQGKSAEAVALARKTTEEDAKSGAAFAVLGTAILAANPEHWNDAIAQAQQGAFLNPKDPDVQMAVGRIFEANGNLEQATLSYQRALESDPGYVPARSALVQAKLRRGDVDAAQADAQKLVSDTPESGEAQLLLGRILLRKGDYPGAAKALEVAVGRGAGGAEASALYGTALQYTRRPSDALAAYRKAVELDANNTVYRTTYGLMLGLNKQYDAGVGELKKVVASPGYKSPDAYVNLGWLYRSMDPKKLEESVGAYKKALEVDPQNEQAALGLGWAWSYMRHWDEAIAAFQKAVELEPKLAGDANNGMAWSFYFKKDLPQAKAYMEKARAAGRNDNHLATNIDKLEKGLAAAEAVPEEEAPPAPRNLGPDVAGLSNTLQRSADAGARRRAARDLVAAGSAGVNPLINALKDRDVGVREQAANSLAALGATAKPAIPYLKSILANKRDDPTIMTDAQMKEAMRDDQFRGAVRDALLRIDK